MAHKYVYSIIRQDLRVEDQIVQVGHSCLLMGAVPPGTRHIVLTVEGQQELLDLFHNMQESNIPGDIFWEPCNAFGEELGWTSITTGMLSKRKKEFFRTLPLYSSQRKLDKMIGVWLNKGIGEINKWKQRRNQLSQRLNLIANNMRTKLGLLVQLLNKRGKRNDDTSSRR